MGNSICIVPIKIPEAHNGSLLVLYFNYARLKKCPYLALCVAGPDAISDAHLRAQKYWNKNYL